MSRSANAYRILVRLLSRDLREEYGEDLGRAFDAMLAEHRVAGRSLAWLRTWGRALADLTALVPRERLERRRRLSARGSTPVEARIQDLRFAFRSLRRQPLFALVAIATIAIGIGGTTTIFSIFNGILFRVPAGVRDAGDLISLHRLGEDGSGAHAFSIPVYRAMAGAAATSVDLAAFDTFAGGLIIEEGEPQRAFGALVSSNYFDVLGTRPSLGRFFHPEEDTVPGRDPVAVISHALWQDRFEADPAVVGTHVRINGTDFTIVGVAEPEFDGHLVAFVNHLWIPLASQGLLFRLADLSDEAARTAVETVGRLAPETSLTQALESLDAAARRHAEARGETWWGAEGFAYTPVFAAARGPIVAFLGAFFVVSAVLLAITSMNVGSMLLSRGAARAREVGVRLALGASRGRVVTLLLTETVVLFVLGGGLGILLAVWATGLIAGIGLPIPIELDLDFSPDAGVMAFAFGLAFVSGSVFGLSPAMHATRGDLVGALKETPGSGRRPRRARSALVVAQVAGSAVLLVAAGLLLRSLSNSAGADPGLDPTGVVSLMPDTRAAGRTVEESHRFYEALLERALALPGVENAALIDLPPLTTSNQQTVAVIPGRPLEPGDGLQRVEYAAPSPGFLATVKIPLLAGRDFDDRDGAESPGVAIVNETFATQAFGRVDVVGEHFGFGSRTDPRDVEIVGVMRDSKVRTIFDPPRPLIYVPWANGTQRDGTLLVRSADPGAAASLRGLVTQLDPSIPPPLVGPYSDLVGIVLLSGKLGVALAGTFGVLGLALASLGLYGVLAYAVIQRSREIGVRIALGSSGREVQRLIVSEGMRLTAIGLGIGLILAVGVARLLQVVLFGVSFVDPATYLAIAIVLTVVSASACWLPARRAAATDPLDALRAD